MRQRLRRDRSHLIAEAVKFYLEHTGWANLRKRLREGVTRRAGGIACRHMVLP